MSEEKDMQSTDVESETDDLKNFVDMADIDDLDVSEGDDFFGDLGDLSDLGDVPELSEIESAISDAKKKKEENTAAKQTESTTKASDTQERVVESAPASQESVAEPEEADTKVETEESVPVPDVASMDSNDDSKMMSDEDIQTLLAANAQESAPEEESSAEVEAEEAETEESIPVPDVASMDSNDGSKMMSDEDIQALLAANAQEPAPEEESSAEVEAEEAETEESVPVPDVAMDSDSSDGSKMMSDEDIQALLAANAQESAPEEESNAEVEPEEAKTDESVPVPDVASMDSNDGSKMMSDEDIQALLAANAQESAPEEESNADAKTEESVSDIAALDDSSEEDIPDIAALDDSSEEDSSEEDIPDIAALDDNSEEDIPDIAALDDSNEEDIPDIAALDDSSEEDVPDITAIDEGLSDNDMESALDALNDEQESSGSGDIDSMLDGLLDNLDMNGTLGEIDGSTEEMPAEQPADGNEEESLDSLADLLGMTGEADEEEPASSGQDEDMQSLLDASLLPDEKEEEAGEKKPGFFKKVFGNVITDEIAQEEREAAEKEAKEAEEKAEKDAADAEEKAKQKEEKKAAKEAKKAEKAKQKAEKKAEKEAKKAEKKAQKEEEEAAELEIVGKLNKVGVAIIVIATILFLTVEIAGTNFWGYTSAKQAANKYFKMGKYTEAYQEALGTKMQDKDPEMYQKIKTVMKVQQSINAYQNYERVGYYPDALNALLQGIRKYDDNLNTAIDLEVDQDLKKCREQILSSLQSEFGISESDAYSLLSLDQDSYTDKVVEIGRQKVK